MLPLPLKSPPLQQLSCFIMIIYLLNPLDSKHFDRYKIVPCFFLFHFLPLFSWLVCVNHEEMLLEFYNKWCNRGYKIITTNTPHSISMTHKTLEAVKVL